MMKPSRTTRSQQKSTFRKVVEWLHLWLGLFSGILVFIVCFTGALWVFRYEVYYFTENYQYVEEKKQPFLSPSVLITKSRQYLTGKGDTTAILRSITYGGRSKCAILYFDSGNTGERELYLNPYNGSIAKDKYEYSATDNFFTFVRAGHRFLWLPPAIGSPIVGSGCLVFLLILITGLIWWYPAKWNRANAKKSFTIKWGARWKRLNVDLHNVFGFYTFLLLILLTLTGVVFTFEWVRNGVYRSLTWQAPPAEAEPPLSDTTLLQTSPVISPVDSVWNMTIRRHPVFGRVLLSLPASASDTYATGVFFGDGTLIYNHEQYYFDQVTLRPLSSAGDEDKPYASLSAGEKTFRMNFDIHTGQILGLPTKIITFFACLIGASLPVTGFLIWWNKRKKKAQRMKGNL